MIVVFVVDTSPSMAEPVSSTQSMSKLDLAKMAVESLSKGLDKRVLDHNREFQQESPTSQQSLHNLGLGYCSPDQFLLLSTGRQYSQLSAPALAACGAGGRLLVGYRAGYHGDAENSRELHQQTTFSTNHGEFERELKRLRATDWAPFPPQLAPGSAVGGQQPQRMPFPEDGGGAIGLNAALSSGLRLLSRYRLEHRATENFGMGRLPSSTILSASAAVSLGGKGQGGQSKKGTATHALQPACLVLVTDGKCLSKPPAEGGGNLTLQFGNAPLREFYREPFRWDQRIYCIGVGDGASRSLHPSLRAFCDVTGGCYNFIQSSSSLSNLSEKLIQLIAPPVPTKMPIPNPLRLPFQSGKTESEGSLIKVTGAFVNGGPVCSFQQTEVGDSAHRALLLHAPCQTDAKEKAHVYQPPIWCIPESFFPDKKLESLPPRSGQPLLHYSRHYQHQVGINTFDPLQLMKVLSRLDQLVASNKQLLSTTGATSQQNNLRRLSRDTYICEWLSQDGRRGGIAPISNHGKEHFPVCVHHAGRPSLSEDESHALNIGILHLPNDRVALSNQEKTSGAGSLSTLTLLPPEPHILLPLLVRAAEAENRELTQASESKDVPNGAHLEKGGSTAGLIKKKQSSTNVAARNVALDEHWRSEFRAYLFRIPSYYQHALRRCLRPILPASAQSLLSTDSYEQIASQCFSRSCLQKIRSGEIFVRESNERLERQEAEVRRRGVQLLETQGQESIGVNQAPIIGHGQFDPRASVHSYLAAIRNMPPPWRVGGKKRGKKDECNDEDREGMADSKNDRKSVPATDAIGKLPAECLLAYYESRRRWIFGGSGLATRGLSVEGVHNDGANCHHHKANHTIENESLLAVTGIGASMLNKAKVSQMGDYRERLLWSRKPVVGYGCNDSTGSAANTGPDGSPIWSADDDALPSSFFDPTTGEFVDSVQNRVRTRLMINFGNPYRHEKRGNSLIPEKYSDQRPPLHHEASDGPVAPTGSPPHDGYSSSVEGEGEAAFSEISRISPSYGERNDSFGGIPKLIHRKRQKKAATKDIGDIPDDLALDGDHPAKSSSQKKKQTRIHETEKRSQASHALSSDAKKKPPPPPPPLPGQQKKSQLVGGKGQLEQNGLSLTRPGFDKHQSDGNIFNSNSTLPPRPNIEDQPLVAASCSSEKMASTSTAFDLQNLKIKPAINLPQEWICVWSKSQKRWYFFDTKTNKSVWEWPPPGRL